MKLASTFNKLEDDLFALRELILSRPPLFVRVTTLPDVLAGQESLPTTNILPEMNYGHEALLLAAKSWADLHIKDGLSQKAARRVPGVVWYADNDKTFSRNLVNLVCGINKSKEAIEQHIITSYLPRERFQPLHDACPGVMTLHLYRQIRLWHCERVQAIRFCWQEKETVTVPDKTKLLLRLASDGEQKPEQGIPLHQLVARVMSTPADKLRIRRKVREQPVANVTFANDDNPAGMLKTVTATMPYIIIQNEKLEMKPLREFIAKKERRSRSDRMKTELLGTFHGENIEMVL